MAGLVCRKKLPERHNGDGTEADAAHQGAVASLQSVQATSINPHMDNRPSVSLAFSSSAVHSSQASLSVVADQSVGQQVGAVTERLADLQLSGGLRRRNGQRHDGQDSVPADDSHQRADELDARRN